VYALRQINTARGDHRGSWLFGGGIFMFIQKSREPRK
jgi:hypothetical protein